MNLPTDTVPAVAETISKVSGLDPFTQGLAWFFGVIVTVLTLAKPFLGLIRQYKLDQVNNARDGADEATFIRQTKQIDALTEEFKKSLEERDLWFKEATELRAQSIELKVRVEKLEGYEEMIDRMKVKLEEKDQIISELRISIKERDERIMTLMQEQLRTNNRIHELEIRLSRDEQKKCLNCGEDLKEI